MKRQKLFYIKERSNPQLGTYYVQCGQLSKTEAKAMESTVYGCNVMHPYQDEKSYFVAINRLKKIGERVQ